MHSIVSRTEQNWENLQPGRTRKHEIAIIFDSLNRVSKAKKARNKRLTVHHFRLNTDRLCLNRKTVAVSLFNLSFIDTCDCVLHNFSCSLILYSITKDFLSSKLGQCKDCVYCWLSDWLLNGQTEGQVDGVVGWRGGWVMTPHKDCSWNDCFRDCLLTVQSLTIGYTDWLITRCMNEKMLNHWF